MINRNLDDMRGGQRKGPEIKRSKVKWFEFAWVDSFDLA
jgi:hypothetical protein